MGDTTEPSRQGKGRHAIAALLFLTLAGVIWWDCQHLVSHTAKPVPAVAASAKAPSAPAAAPPAGIKSVSELLRQLKSGMDESRQRDSARSDKIAALLEKARANDSVENGKEALKSLDEIIRLDPDDAEAAQLREKISGYYGPEPAYAGPPVITNSIGMHLTYIAPGTFIMGSGVSEPGRSPEEQPRHKVTLNRGFFMGTHHITVGEFRKFVTATGYTTAAEENDAPGNWQDTFEQADDHPVVWITWKDAVAFANWLSRSESRSYHLPTEAEWEYCCRAGTTTAYPWGDDPDDGNGWANCADATLSEKGLKTDVFHWRDGFVHTSPVGSFKPNAFGLYDMIGNAAQWCSDRAIRGGSWMTGPSAARSAWRHAGLPTSYGPEYGFRLVMERNDLE